MCSVQLQIEYIYSGVALCDQLNPCCTYPLESSSLHKYTTYSCDCSYSKVAIPAILQHVMFWGNSGPHLQYARTLVCHPWELGCK